MSKKYEIWHDGTWDNVNMNRLDLMCCDCLLVHTIKFRYDEKTGLKMKVKRNERATAAARKKKAK